MLMAASGLLVLQLHPPEFSLLPQAVTPLLLAYVVFAIAVLVREWLGWARPSRYDWIDLGWTLALTSATGGTSSVLFFMLLLPIISRAFREGFEAGWRMTLITTVSLLALGLPASPGGAMFEIDRAMIRPFTLLILGYILSREGGSQRRAYRQLALLAGINAVGNPRFGADRSLLDAARRVRQSYAVRECLILLRRESGEPVVLARATHTDEKVERLPDRAATLLLQLPPAAGVLHKVSETLSTQNVNDDLREACLALSDVLDGPAFLSVPLRRGEETVGRLFIVDDGLPQFDVAELGFLERLSTQLMLIIERIDLLDRLTAVAALSERRRLAHDLHDLAIQPYLGVQLGLSAMQRRVDCPPALAGELSKLRQLAEQGVSELRGLLESRRADDDGRVDIAEALAGMSSHYAEQFGITVEVQIQAGLDVQRPLAGELLAILVEALSNVRRHTTVSRARICIVADADQLRVEISNPNADGKPSPYFVPRSISGRVRELGGVDAVHPDRDGCTVLSLSIPR